MDYIQFTIAASRLDLADAEEFWEWLVEQAAVEYHPTGSYTLVEGMAVFTLTLAMSMVRVSEAMPFCMAVALRLEQRGFDLHQFTGIHYTDDDILTYKVSDETQEPA